MQAAHVRDLRGVIEREKAEIGALISMEPAIKPMQKEAAGAGFYQSPGISGAKMDKFPRIQLLSIEELLTGKRLEYPRLLELTYKKAPKARTAAAKNEPLPFSDSEIDEPF